jgi:hypothetical protein
MAGYERNPDVLAQIRDLQEQVRRLRTKTPDDEGLTGGKFMDTHSFIVGGPVDPSLYIPPAHIYLPDPGEEGIADQATSVYWNYGHYCRSGSVGVILRLKRAGVETAITDTTTLQYNDQIRVQIMSGSGEDLTVWYVLIHSF